MKLLFVHEVGYLSKPIFEMHEFPELLAKRGNVVTFLQFDEGRKFWKAVGSSVRSITARTQPVEKIELETPWQLGIPGLDRLLATITFIPKLVSLLARNKYDAIVLYAVPTYGWQTILLAKVFRVPVLFRALDVSHKIRKSVFAQLIKLSEKFIYKNADFLSANNAAMQEYCVELSKRTKPSATQLPPLDLSHFKPLEKRDEKLARSLGLEAGDKVLAYMGSFFYFSGLKQVIMSFAEKAAATDQSVKLLLIGGGEQDSELRNLVADLGLDDRIIFTGFIDYKLLNDYVGLADVAINPMVPGLVSNTAFPHKMLQYMALGVPTVSTSLKGLKQTFGNTSGITWVENPEDVVAAAFTLVSSKSQLIAAAKKQLEAIRSRFNMTLAVDVFENTLKELSR